MVTVNSLSAKDFTYIKFLPKLMETSVTAKRFLLVLGPILLKWCNFILRWFYLGFLINKKLIQRTRHRALNQHSINYAPIFTFSTRPLANCLFFVYFCLFKQTLQLLKQVNVKKCPSSILHRDLDSQPSDYKSPPLTTRLVGSRPLVYHLHNHYKKAVHADIQLVPF